MNTDLKKILSALILVMGYLAFIIPTSYNNFTLGLIYLSLAIILWLIFVLVFDIFSIRNFAGIISGSGLMVSVSTFFLFGVEEVPFPAGAIIFHLEGIATSLGICLFSLFPIIPFLSIKKEKNNSLSTTNKANIISKENTIEPRIFIDHDEDWELATEDDLQSGEFEVG